MGDTGDAARPAGLRDYARRLKRRLKGDAGRPLEQLSKEQLIARIASPGIALDSAGRIVLLAIGDVLLKGHGDVASALRAYLRAYDCDPVAKWEFGERLLDGLEHGKIKDRDLRTIVETLAGRPENVIAPDLWLALAQRSFRSLSSEEGGPLLALLLPLADQHLLHEIFDDAHIDGARWATTQILEALRVGLDQGAFTAKADFHLKGGLIFLAAGRIADAVSSFKRAQKLDRESKFHIGSHVIGLADTLVMSNDDLLGFIKAMDDPEDLLAPDLGVNLLERLSAYPRSLENLKAADNLVRLLPRDKLIWLGDQALVQAHHDLAIYSYEEAIKKDPEDISTRLQLGITQYLANDHRAAEAHFAILMSLQASERERWGVKDLPVRVMHWTWIQAFGHITCLDTYIKAVKLGWLPEHRTLLGFDRTEPPSGWRLLTYFSKYLEIVGANGDPAPVLDELIFGKESQGLTPNQKDLRRASLMYFFWALPNKEGRMRYFGNIGSDVQQAWKAAGHGPLLSIDEEERSRFRLVMEQSFGLPKDAWYALLHVRESSFKPGWETHHRYTRNATIDSYDQAIEYITSKGGWVIRAGDPSMRRIAPRKNVIDYATSSLRSPELDVLLCSECRFFVGTNSGFSLAPPLFGKRCVLTNWSPLANPNWYPDDIFIPKLVRERKTGSYLTIEDMYRSKAGWSQFLRDFQTDWEKLDNTPEDILAVVREMMNELELGVVRTPDALRREALYQDIVLRNDGYVGSRLSDGFLERNLWLLEARSPRFSHGGQRSIAPMERRPGALYRPA